MHLYESLTVVLRGLEIMNHFHYKNESSAPQQIRNDDHGHQQDDQNQSAHPQHPGVPITGAPGHLLLHVT